MVRGSAQITAEPGVTARYAEGMKDRELRPLPGPPGRGEGVERWTVDAVEDAAAGPVARLEREDGVTVTLPLNALPGGLREGDVLAVQPGADGASVRVLPDETAERRRTAQARLDALNTAADDGETAL